MFEFKITKKDKKSRARTGLFTTPHGQLETPNLAFVATEGKIKAIPKGKINKIEADLIICNTFHLFTKKISRFKANYKIHQFSGFHKPIMSDSGGFQAFSLGFGKVHGVGKIASIFPEEGHPTGVLTLTDRNNPLTINENGVEFVYNGKKVLLTPEKSIKIQEKIGADIIFAFDECTSPLNTKKYTKEAMERTHRWLSRCIDKWKNRRREISAPDQALFAIVQGGYFEDLRKRSARFVGSHAVPGFGIGGSLGKTKDQMLKVIDWTVPYLPDEKPRHLLGIGQVKDIFDCVERGIDLFDCVIPTREARHKVIYTNQGKINVRKMKTVNKTADKNCSCQSCFGNITMKQLNDLFAVKHPLAFYYATVHNVYFFSNLMKEIRRSLIEDRFQSLKNKYLKYYSV